MRLCLTCIGAGTFILAIVIIPGLAWYRTGDPAWAFGWIALLILGLAG